jgi:hypothetical protein
MGERSGSRNLPKIHRVKVEVHPPDMHPAAASYTPRLQKLAIKRHQYQYKEV